MYHVIFFFFNDTATTEIYTLSLPDALPIYVRHMGASVEAAKEVKIFGLSSFLIGRYHALARALYQEGAEAEDLQDRKSTRLNSSHTVISYAAFCLKHKTPSTMIHITALMTA